MGASDFARLLNLEIKIKINNFQPRCHHGCGGSDLVFHPSGVGLTPGAVAPGEKLEKVAEHRKQSFRQHQQQQQRFHVNSLQVVRD